MFFEVSLVLLLLQRLLHFTAAADGVGPTGIYAINHEYVAYLAGESDSLVVANVLKGGIEGHVVLHDPSANPHMSDLPLLLREEGSSEISENWVWPTGLASCDFCDFVYITTLSAPYFLRVELGRPLLDMAKDGDFSLLQEAFVEARPFAPIEASRHLRHVAITRDGSAGYIFDQELGFLQFDPLQIDGGAQTVEVMDEYSFLPFETKTRECQLSSDERYLMTASGTRIYLIDLKSKAGEVVEVNTNKLCRDLDDIGFTWLVSMVNKDLYIMGRKTDSVSNAFALFRLPFDDNLSTWNSCELIAGKTSEARAWRDGKHDRARFSRPHAMAALPTNDALVITDMDNRAIRLANITKAWLGHVWTVHTEATLHEAYGVGLPPPYMERTAPTIEESPTMRMDLEEAVAVCHARGKRLCMLEEVRAHIKDVFTASFRPVSFWTVDKCTGCKLQGPGICSPTNTSLDVAMSRDGAEDGSSWGMNYRKLTHVSNWNGTMRTECTLEYSVEESDVVCCGMTNPHPDDEPTDEQSTSLGGPDDEIDEPTENEEDQGLEDENIGSLEGPSSPSLGDPSFPPANQTGDTLPPTSSPQVLPPNDAQNSTDCEGCTTTDPKQGVTTSHHGMHIFAMCVAVLCVFVVGAAVGLGSQRGRRRRATEKDHGNVIKEVVCRLKKIREERNKAMLKSAIEAFDDFEDIDLDTIDDLISNLPELQ